MRDAGHRTPDIGRRTSDGEKSKNNISTPQGGGHNDSKVSSFQQKVLYSMFIYNNDTMQFYPTSMK